MMNISSLVLIPISLKYPSIRLSSVTGCAATAMFVLFLYTCYACCYEKLRFSNPDVRRFKAILMCVAVCVTSVVVIVWQTLQSIIVWESRMATVCSDPYFFCTTQKLEYCTDYGFEKCPCVCNETIICGNKTFRNENGYSCLYYDIFPERCGDESLYECCACDMPQDNNITWTDVEGRSCMFYKSWFVYCGVYDPQDQQTAWEACPTFCNKSDILGDEDWVDKNGYSCLFYQKELTADI
jgi:hypothetical protein